MGCDTSKEKSQQPNQKPQQQGASDDAADAAKTRFAATFSKHNPDYSLGTILYESGYNFADKTVIWSATKNSMQQQQQQQRVVVKCLWCTFDAEDDASELMPLFVREIIISRLQSRLCPNSSVQVLDAFWWRDDTAPDPKIRQNCFFLCMVMPLANRGTVGAVHRDLAEKRAAEPSMSREPMAVFFVAELLKALGQLHRMGLLHRDVKSSNMLIEENADEDEPRIRLCDYGLARATGAAAATQDGKSYDDFWISVLAQPRCGRNNSDDTTATSSRRCHGTCCPLTDVVASRPYRAPELLAGTMSYGSAVDIWSAGCVLAELVASGKDGFALFRDPVDEHREAPDDATAHPNQLEVVLKKLNIASLTPRLVEALHIDPKLDTREEVMKVLSSNNNSSSARTVVDVDDFVRYDWDSIKQAAAPLSPECKQALDSMLQINPVKRLSADQLLKLPFFAAVSSENAGGSNEEIGLQQAISELASALSSSSGKNNSEDSQFDLAAATLSLVEGCRSSQTAKEVLLDGRVARLV